MFVAGVAKLLKKRGRQHRKEKQNMFKCRNEWETCVHLHEPERYELHRLCWTPSQQNTLTAESHYFVAGGASFLVNYEALATLPSSKSCCLTTARVRNLTSTFTTSLATVDFQSPTKCHLKGANRSARTPSLQNRARQRWMRYCTGRCSTRVLNELSGVRNHTIPARGSWSLSSRLLPCSLTRLSRVQFG